MHEAPERQCAPAHSGEMAPKRVNRIDEGANVIHWI
jgi:hypothetical protein